MVFLRTNGICIIICFIFVLFREDNFTQCSMVFSLYLLAIAMVIRKIYFSGWQKCTASEPYSFIYVGVVVIFGFEAIECNNFYFPIFPLFANGFSFFYYTGFYQRRNTLFIFYKNFYYFVSAMQLGFIACMGYTKLYIDRLTFRELLREKFQVATPFNVVISDFLLTRVIPFLKVKPFLLLIGTSSSIAHENAFLLVAKRSILKLYI